MYRFVAPKITGMVLALDQTDFDLVISNFELFKTKVMEAN